SRGRHTEGQHKGRHPTRIGQKSAVPQNTRVNRRKAHPGGSVETHTSHDDQRGGQEGSDQAQEQESHHNGHASAHHYRFRVAHALTPPRRDTATSIHTDIAAARGTSCPANAAFPINTASVQLCGLPSTKG